MKSFLIILSVIAALLLNAFTFGLAQSPPSSLKKILKVEKMHKSYYATCDVSQPPQKLFKKKDASPHSSCPHIGKQYQDKKNLKHIAKMWRKHNYHQQRKFYHKKNGNKHYRTPRFRYEQSRVFELPSTYRTM